MVELLQLGLNCTKLANLTRFQSIQETSTQPYFMTGFILTFVIIMLIWFFMGFVKVGPLSKKIRFESSIHWSAIVLILLLAVLQFIWFFAPWHLSFLGG